MNLDRSTVNEHRKRSLELLKQMMEERSNENKKKNNEDTRLLPFCVIKAATEGDILAIHKVLNHYERYITSSSVRRMKHKFGNVHYCVDETLRQHLQTKLLMTILNFKLIR